jgi:3-oxoacyl-[acyl-carrier-protein] synthase-1
VTLIPASDRMPRADHAPAITARTVTSALGVGCAAHREALAAGRGGLRPNDFTGAPLQCWIGRVAGLEDLPLPPSLARFDSRTHRLAWHALHADAFDAAVAAARARHGAARIACVLGTSTSSIGATEEAYARLQHGRMPDDLRRREIHHPHALAAFVSAALQLDGPTLTISTACSSSAKVFAAGARLLRHGLADAVLVGGADSLCGSTLFGFNALELIAPEPCRPFDRGRRGLSIGEGAGFALLERAAAVTAARAPRLLGCGESSDAHHLSAPHPEGLGARQAITAALAAAGLTPRDVDYLNLHGTASPQNDAVEAALVGALFPRTLRASSSKGATGHTLGAAGIVEAVITLLALEHGLVPGTHGCRDPEPAIAAQLALAPESRVLRIALSASFGFGGSNACLAFVGAQS